MAKIDHGIYFPVGFGVTGGYAGGIVQEISFPVNGVGYGVRREYNFSCFGRYSRVYFGVFFTGGKKAGEHDKATKEKVSHDTNIRGSGTKNQLKRVI